MRRVIVVGAGLAGLSAAGALRRRGCDVVVLEARDRVGGRVWSRTLPDGSVIEMGAEFVLPGNPLVEETARRLGLAKWAKGMAYGRREPRGGGAVTEDDLRAAAAAIERLLAGGAHESAAELLDRLDAPAAVRDAIRARVEVSAGAPAEHVGADELAGVAAFSDEPSWSIAGGNQRIAHALAEPLSDRLRLSTPVRRIAWSDDAVEVEGAAADAVVVAVPAPVLGSIDFDPPLPAPLRDALAGLRHGDAAKLFVPLRERPPTSAVLSVPERYWTWTATADGVVQPVVHAFAGSAAALERLEVAAGPGRWLESLARLRPDLELDPAGAVLSTWSDDPWARGAYSVHTPGGNDEALQRRYGGLVLAGEHTAGAKAALMEGALGSGLRAAAQLLA